MSWIRSILQMNLGLGACVASSITNIYILLSPSAEHVRKVKPLMFCAKTSADGCALEHTSYRFVQNTEQQLFARTWRNAEYC